MLVAFQELTKRIHVKFGSLELGSEAAKSVLK